MDLDAIRLVDNHLVVNLKEFITLKTNHLTRYAMRNLPSCCVGIQYVYADERQACKKSTVRCTLDILLQAAGFVEDGLPERGEQSEKEQRLEVEKIDYEIERINKTLMVLPGSFSASLRYHMERKGYTEDLLAQKSWVSLSTIKQYRQKEEKEKTLKTVTALCIGLHLHPWFTEDLLRKAGIIPKARKQDSAYRFLYTMHYKERIEECNKYLRASGLQEYTLREKSV